MTKHNMHSLEEALALPDAPEFTGYSYILDMGDRIKVGITEKPRKRLRDHMQSVFNFEGNGILGVLVTVPHHNYKENETKLKRLLRVIPGKNEVFDCPISDAIEILNTFTYEDDVAKLQAKANRAKEHTLNFLLNMDGDFMFDVRILTDAFNMNYHSLTSLIIKYEHKLGILGPVSHARRPVSNITKNFTKNFSKHPVLTAPQLEMLITLLQSSSLVRDFNLELIRRRRELV